MKVEEQNPIPVTRRQLVMAMALPLLLIIGSLVVYYPALKAGFIWDDDFHFTANRNVARWKGIIDIWTSRDAMYYPLVLSTGWALHKVAGFNPAVFHGVTFALHVANVLLLVAVLRRFRIPGAWVAGFLFAWHPMQVESVAWVSELKNTQSAFFLFCSVLALQQSGFFRVPDFRDKSARRWHVASIGFFLLALLSKPSVVTVPVALAALVWWKREVKSWRDVDGLFPFLILSILASGWTVWEQRFSSGAHGFEWSQSLLERLVLSGQVVWFYAHKLVWPNPLMFLYPQWAIDPGRLLSYAPLLLFVLAGAGCWWKRNTVARYPGLVLICFLVMLFPVAGLFNVYFMRYAWVADHFVYLASIPVFAGAGALWALLHRRWKFVALGLAVVLLAVCGWRSHMHARTFRNPETLWRAALEVNPAAWMAHNNLGLILRGQGDRDAARHHFEQALVHNPRHYEAMNNLGSLLQDQGRREEALDYFDRALNLKPELYHGWINRGNLLRDMGDIDGAYESFSRARDYHPGLEVAWVNTALLAEGQGDGARAIEAYLGLLKNKNLSDEQVGGFLFERAYRISTQGHADLAMQFLLKAEELAPLLADIFLLKGELHEKRHDYSAAEKAYRVALNRRPDWGAVLLRLSKVLAVHPDPDKRQIREAFTMLDAMMAAGGNQVPEIVDVYAMALSAAGRYGEAMQAQRHAMSLVKDQPDRVRDMQTRLHLYETGKSYSLPAGPST